MRHSNDLHSNAIPASDLFHEPFDGTKDRAQGAELACDPVVFSFFPGVPAEHREALIALADAATSRPIAPVTRDAVADEPSADAQPAWISRRRERVVFRERRRNSIKSALYATASGSKTKR